LKPCRRRGHRHGFAQFAQAWIVIGGTKAPAMLEHIAASGLTLPRMARFGAYLPDDYACQLELSTDELFRSDFTLTHADPF
jgi:hypothetical protein